ncbi:MAG: alpha/beta fold hydrolase [Planctomycetota bacterium]|jgi:pimeloyl-ACP methyl ester carboxylesterase
MKTILEYPFTCQVDGAQIVGMVSEGVGGLEDSRLGVILLNPGLNHRVGPHRMHVRIARHLAALGVHCARFDFSGLGDSDVRQGEVDLKDCILQEVDAVARHLCSGHGVERVLLIGLCAGGGAAFLASGELPSVVGAALLNTRRFDENQEAVESWRSTSETRMDARFYWRVALFRASSWKRLFSGRSSVGKVIRATLFHLRERLFPNRTLKAARTRILQELEELHTKQVRLLFLASETDISADLMRFLFRDGSAEGHELVWIPRTDHTFTWGWSQERLLQELSRWVESFAAPDA